MTNPSCASCGGTRWVRYLSETLDGDFEEAFRLCPATTSQKGKANALVKTQRSWSSSR